MIEQVGRTRLGLGLLAAAFVSGCGSNDGGSIPDAGVAGDAIATIDAASGCPEPDPPMAARLTCHMREFLLQAGFDEHQIVDDGAILPPPGGEILLIKRGFSVKPGTGSYRAIYELGDNPTFHGDGQRVAYATTGTIYFLSFASANGGFVEEIVLSSQGDVIEHDVFQID